MPQRDKLYLSYQRVNTPVFCFGRRHYILHNCLPYKHPQKDGPDQDS